MTKFQYHETAAPLIAPTVTTTGLWECDLATETLTWSDGVYDLFGLPRQSPIQRGAMIWMYDNRSRIELECLRAAAIRDRTGFSLDARICTAAGAERWIRITAKVFEPSDAGLRLFGAKQDVTYEHELWAALGR